MTHNHDYEIRPPNPQSIVVPQATTLTNRPFAPHVTRQLPYGEILRLAEENAILRQIAAAVAQLDVVESMEDYLTCPFDCGGEDVVLGSPERFEHTIDCPISVARHFMQEGPV